MIKCLLEGGGDANAFDDWGVSCLQLAVKKGNKEIVELLLRHGANANVSDADGDTTTPLHAAAQLGSLEISEMLVRAGAGNL